jgi:hypothetical protein
LLEQEVKRTESDLMRLVHLPEFINELHRTEKSMAAVYAAMNSQS